MISFLQENSRRFTYVILFLATLVLIAAVDIEMTLAGNPLSDETIWYLIRSSGIVAYLLLTASTAWGILLSSKLVKEWIPAPVALEMHNYLSWTALGLTIYHAYLLLFSSFFDYQWIELFIPFTGPYKPLWVGLGIVSVYLMLLTSLTFYVSKQIGYTTFRRIHYLTYAVFGLALAHSLMAGTDGTLLQNIYTGSGLLILFLTVYRVFSGQPTTSKTTAELPPYTLINR